MLSHCLEEQPSYRPTAAAAFSLNRFTSLIYRRNTVIDLWISDIRYLGLFVIFDIGQDRWVEIVPEDIRVDVIRTIGGGACAVRITHVPTGTAVTVDDQPSISENRE
jgi:hypothetical protein